MPCCPTQPCSLQTQDSRPGRARCRRATQQEVLANQRHWASSWAFSKVCSHQILQRTGQHPIPCLSLQPCQCQCQCNAMPPHPALPAADQPQLRPGLPGAAEAASRACWPTTGTEQVPSPTGGWSEDTAPRAPGASSTPSESPHGQKERRPQQRCRATHTAGGGVLFLGRTCLGRRAPAPTQPPLTHLRGRLATGIDSFILPSVCEDGPWGFSGATTDAIVCALGGQQRGEWGMGEWRLEERKAQVMAAPALPSWTCLCPCCLIAQRRNPPTHSALFFQCTPSLELS